MKNMGIIKASLRLVNTADEVKLDEGMIAQESVKELTEVFLVDTGAFMLCINETMRELPGLRHFGYESYKLLLKRLNTILSTLSENIKHIY